MSDVAIKIEGVSKKYTIGKQKENSLRGSFGGLLKSAAAKGEEFWALKDISFKVNKGEVIGVIGKNGAGKSTLLKLLSRVTGPTTGKIKVKGKIASLLEVGTGFHPELTGRENIFLNGAILGMTKNDIRLKFDEIVEFAGVAKYIDTPVKRYSSGMYVRLAFAVAAHLEPDILVVDEVLAVGDAEFQKKAIGKMQDVSTQGGRTVLFVSHNMASIEKLCEKSVLLENGKQTLIADSRSVINRYLELSSNRLGINYSGSYNFRETNDNKKGIVFVETLCDNKISYYFKTKSNLKIRTYISDDRLDKDTVLGLVIRNPQNEALIGINNNHCGIKLLEEPTNKCCIEISIPSLPFYEEGQYSIDLFLGSYNQDYETIENVIKIYIRSIDVYGSGKLLLANINKVIIQNIDFKDVVDEIKRE